MNIGKSIKDIRCKKGLNQKTLSEYSGISAYFLGLIECGKTFPSKKSIINICKGLEIPVSYLLFHSITEDDIPENKKEVFNVLSGLKDLLI